MILMCGVNGWGSKCNVMYCKQLLVTFYLVILPSAILLTGSLICVFVQERERKGLMQYEYALMILTGDWLPSWYNFIVHVVLWMQLSSLLQPNKPKGNATLSDCPRHKDIMARGWNVPLSLVHIFWLSRVWPYPCCLGYRVHILLHKRITHCSSSLKLVIVS